MSKSFVDKRVLNVYSCKGDDFYNKHSLCQYKKDRNFKEMRKEIFFASRGYSLEIWPEYITEYIKKKNELKNKNKMAQDLFKDKKVITMNAFLIKFGYDNILVSHKCFKKKITKCKFIDSDDDIECILFEDSENFYVFRKQKFRENENISWSLADNV